jgi:Ca2+-transporting ATPase
VGASLALVLAVIYIPVLNPIFQTEPLTGAEWELVLPLLLIPSIVAELTKVAIRAIARNKKTE